MTILCLLLPLLLGTTAPAAALSYQCSSPVPQQKQSSDDRYKAHLRAKIAGSVAKGERREGERNKQRREECPLCARPPSLCVCSVLPPERLETRTKVLVLQHPNERRKRNFSTVPLMRLVLQKVQVVVGYAFQMEEIFRQSAELRETLEKGRRPLLLYPSETAISLDQDISNGDHLLAQHLSNNDSLQHIDIGDANNHLILIDGTWTEAKRMVRDSPSLLKHCQPVQFTAESLSIYDAVRKEPKGHCLSTLEACGKALNLLEPHNCEVQKYLNAVLRAHVESHLANEKIMAPRSAGKAAQKLYEKNKRRREIELELFQQQLIQERRIPLTIGTTQPSPRRIVELHAGATVRPLEVFDAPLVDSWWDYRSDKSLGQVQRRIELDEGIGACLGVEVEGRGLVACLVRYEGGALGMLHTLPAYRRRGYASAMLRLATQTLQARGDECVSLIVDGNTASEGLFASQGWQRADPAVKRGTGKRRAKRKWVFPPSETMKQEK